MNQSRRVFLKGSLAGSMVAVAAGAGLLAPRAVLAAWPEAAFEAKSMEAAMQAVVGDVTPASNDDVKIKAPDIAENGSVVPITVDCALADIDVISVLARENARPLCVNYHMTDGVDGYVSTRIKMGKTSEVMAVVKTKDGKMFSAKKSVKVTLGGCGG